MLTQFTTHPRPPRLRRPTRRVRTFRLPFRPEIGLVKANAVNPSASAVVARYAYDGFGKEVAVTGVDAEKNSFRFSTKQFDAETGMNYYGYRYYAADTGRWINRDLIEEDGGLNVYTMVENDLIVFFDADGLASRSSGGGAFGQSDGQIPPPPQAPRGKPDDIGKTPPVGPSKRGEKAGKVAADVLDKIGGFTGKQLMLANCRKQKQSMNLPEGCPACCTIYYETFYRSGMSDYTVYTSSSASEGACSDVKKANEERMKREKGAIEPLPPRARTGRGYEYVQM